MKTIKIIGLAVLTLTILGLTSSAFAATYQYVDTAGNLRSVEANSPEQALAIAPNIGIHSGVDLYSGTALNSTTYTGNYTGSGLASNQDTGVTYNATTYQYVNTSGQLQTIPATNAEQAFSLATNIAPKSGVIRVGAYQIGA